MVELSAVKDGDVLYGVFSVKMGNTTMSRKVVREFRVHEVKSDPPGAYLYGSGGKSWYSARRLKPLRRTKPKVVDRI